MGCGMSYSTTTTMSVLMLLSRLAGLAIFCFNFFSPFPLVRILSSQAISFQILFYALFPRFPWSTVLPFPNYFNFHNLTYLELMSPHVTWPYNRRRLWIISSIFTTTHILSRRTSFDTLSISLTLNTILIIWRSTPRSLTSPHPQQ